MTATINEVLGKKATITLRDSSVSSRFDVNEERVRDKSRLLGICLVALGLGVSILSVFVGDEMLSGMGLASFLIGGLLIYLHSQPVLSPAIVEASVLSSLANLDRVLRDLAPDTKAVYLEIRDRLDPVMVFLPFDDDHRSRSMIRSDDRFIFVEGNGGPGLLLEAPGSSLLKLMEKESGFNFYDSSREDFIDSLRSGLVESLEVVDDLKVSIDYDGVSFKILDGPLRSLTRSLPESAPTASSLIGCPICSTTICATVKALKCSMLLEEAIHQPGNHVIKARFMSEMKS